MQFSELPAKKYLIPAVVLIFVCLAVFFGWKNYWSGSSFVGIIVSYPSLEETGRLKLICSNRENENDRRVLVLEPELVRDLKASNIIPNIGDLVRVDRSERNKESTVTVRSTEGFSLIKKNILVSANVPEFSARHQWEKVIIEGEVTGFSDQGPQRIIVIFNGRIYHRILVPEELVRFTGPIPRFDIGDSLEVTGTVVMKKNRFFVVPLDSSSIKVIKRKGTIEAGNLNTVAELKPESTGEYVRLSGRIIRISDFAGGFDYLIEDGTGKIDVLVDREVYREISNKDDYQIGEIMSVRGKLEYSQGEFQVIPATADDLSLKKRDDRERSSGNDEQ